ncbi:MAG: hypothetical protein NC429_03245 [Lachnospiraceae bacterium]|nr:hypothetical protein [Lachnospiraceae bacterium]
MKTSNKIEYMFKKNWLFILIIIAALGIYTKRNMNLQTEIVSWPDTAVVFSTDMTVISQTWQPQIKNVKGIYIECEPQNNFETVIEMRIEEGESVLAECSVEYAFLAEEKKTLEFSFDTSQVEPGKRYSIELNYLNPERDGAIKLSAGTEYGGCQIDGKDTGSALAYKIKFAKPSRLWWLFICFAPIFAIALLFMLIWNKKFEETVALALIAVGMILYSAGLSEKLHTGIIIVILLSIVSFLASIYLFNRKKAAFKDLLTPGLLIYFILIGFIVLNAYDLYLAKWDEYSHWGLAVKDMYFYSCFGKHVNSTLLLPRYFPFATLIEYWFMYHNELFSESILYVGFQVMLLSALIPVTKSIQKGWKYLFPALAVLILVPVTFFYDVSNCIYVDPLMAAWTGYILICYFSERFSVFNWCRITAGIFALVMTKDAGIVLAGCVLLIIAGDMIYQHFKEKHLNKVQWGVSVLWAVLAIAFFFSWQVYLSMPAQDTIEKENTVNTIEKESTEKEQQAEENLESKERKKEKEPVSFATISASGITKDKIQGMLNHEGAGYYDEVIQNYIIRLFDGDTYNLGNIGFSYMDLLIVSVLIICVLMIRINPHCRNRMLVFATTIVIAGVIYAGFMLVCYLFAFSKEEAIKLSSYARYMSGYLAGVIIAGLSLLLMEMSRLQEGNKVRQNLLIGMLTILIVIVPAKNFLTKNMYEAITPNKRHGYDEIQQLIRSVGAEAENIYFVCNDSNGEAYYMFKNAACPLKVPYVEWNIFASEELYLKQCDINAENGHQTIPGRYLSIEQLSDKLKQCQYIYLFHPNEVFAESYGELFIEPEKIGDGTFYQVQMDSAGEVRLSYIGKVGILSYE